MAEQSGGERVPDIQEIRNQIEAEFNKEGIHKVLQRLASDQHTRLIRKTNPVVVPWEVSPDADRAYYDLKPLPGSVTLFWAKKGSDLLRELEAAYSSKDVERLKILSKKVTRDALSRSVISISKVVEQMIDAPAYFDLRYGCKTQARNLALVNGIEIGCLPFPYNGGRLRYEDFTIVEYYRPRYRSEYDYLVLVNPPRLTELERIALEAVPADQLELHLGSASRCWGWCAVTVVVVVVITVVVGCQTCHQKLDEVSLPPETIERLGSVASARELVNLRRELFLQCNL